MYYHVLAFIVIVLILLKHNFLKGKKNIKGICDFFLTKHNPTLTSCVSLYLQIQ